LPFHFGDFVLDPERRELRSATKEVFAVEAQGFDVWSSSSATAPAPS
jgi:hypothetical protein